MTLEQFASILETAGYPVAYHHFKEAQTKPYVVYTVEDEPDMMADNEHYLPITAGFVELYTEKKDIGAETKVKNALRSGSVLFSFENADYIESERMYLTRYNYQITGG